MTSSDAVLKLSPTVAALQLILACELPAVKTIYLQPEGPDRTSRASQPAGGDNSSLERAGDPSHHWIQVDQESDTLFKREAVDSATLERDDKCPLPRGTRHSLAEAPQWQDSHIKITLEKEMAGCPFRTGWVFAGHVASSSDEKPASFKKTHTGVATLYTTENTPMEGGPLDRCGRKLNTLDDYMNWRANEVSVAMDRLALPYGTLIRIPAIEKRLNVADPIPFRVVDTGSAFQGKGLSRLDICVGHSQDTIYSSKYVWMSHASFEYEIIKLGDSFACY